MLHDIEIVFIAALDLVGWGQGLGMDVVYVPQLQCESPRTACGTWLPTMWSPGTESLPALLTYSAILLAHIAFKTVVCLFAFRDV